MTTRRLILFALAATLAAAGASAAKAGDFAPRQYYSDWHQHGSYHYRHYYYKPRPEYVGYRHHYLVHYDNEPRHHYFYNPYKRRFWGRCDAYSQSGEGSYQQLAPEYQRPTIAQIPESAFPPPGPMPAIPDSTDGGKLDLPPDNAPEGPPAGPGGAVGPGGPAGPGGARTGPPGVGGTPPAPGGGPPSPPTE